MNIISRTPLDEICTFESPACSHSVLVPLPTRCGTLSRSGRASSLASRHQREWCRRRRRQACGVVW